MKHLLLILMLATAACSKQTEPKPSYGAVTPSQGSSKATQMTTGLLLEVNRTGQPPKQVYGFRISWVGGGYTDYALQCVAGAQYTSRLIVTDKIMQSWIMY